MRLVFLIILSVCSSLYAQDSMIAKKSVFSFSYFLDLYYSFDFNKSENNEKPPYVYNHKRNNEVNLNLALISVTYQQRNIRSNLGIMAGTYPHYNLSSELTLLRNLYEANVGIKVSKNKELWLDAGIFPSHIGFESPISKDCWTLTRSIAAENSPYYQAGGRLSYKTTNSRFYLAGFILNGWQRITRINHNHSPAFGTQITYNPDEKLTINSSSFMGNDKPDSARQWRYFHNLFFIWKISKRWGLTTSFDSGLEQAGKGSSTYNTWFAPVMILRFQPHKWAVVGRAEYYVDRKGTIISLAGSKPFQMQGYSVNLDYPVRPNLIWRLEGRFFKSTNPYFVRGNEIISTNFSVTTSLSIDFPNKADD